MALRVADATVPLELSLDVLNEGRTFSAMTCDVAQGERRCARATLLLGVPAPDVVTHSVPADDVPGPYDAVPYDMGVTGRDLRVVEAAYTDDPAAPEGPPSIDAWVRFREVPDDPAIHAGLLAQFTGHMSIAAPRSGPMPGSGNARPTARCRRRSTPSPSPSTPRCAWTAGCCTGTWPRWCTTAWRTRSAGSTPTGPWWRRSPWRPCSGHSTDPRPTPAPRCSGRATPQPRMTGFPPRPPTGKVTGPHQRS